MLWEGSLVMVDQETQSLWSHLLGAAMRGPLEGKSLDVIPSLVTDWLSWKETHPESTVAMMSKTSGSFVRKLWNPDSGLVIGLVNQRESRTWDYGLLSEHPVVNDQFDGKPVVVVYDRLSHTPAVYERSVAGQQLTFRLENAELVDEQTDTRWNLFSGRAVSGPLKGEQLNRLPSIVSDSAAWFTFYPHTKGWRPGQEEDGAAPVAPSL